MQPNDKDLRAALMDKGYRILAEKAGQTLNNTQYSNEVTVDTVKLNAAIKEAMDLRVSAGLFVFFSAKPTITGPTTMEMNTGYTATSTGEYLIEGPTVRLTDIKRAKKSTQCNR